MDNNIRFLGLAKKAGHLEIGEESCAAALRGGQVQVLLVAQDASDASKRRAKTMAGSGVPYMLLPYTKNELGDQVGRGTPGILAITDIGLAANFAAKLASAYPGSYEDAAAKLSEKEARFRKRQAEAKAHLRNVKTGKRRIQK